MKPTQDEIKAEVKLLKEQRGQIPPSNAFGDSNIDRIDAEIDVLENNLTDREIDAKYGDDETADEYTGPSGAYESAGYARGWLDGDAIDGSMSENWKPLIGVSVKRIAPQ